MDPNFDNIIKYIQSITRIEIVPFDDKLNCVSETLIAKGFSSLNQQNLWIVSYLCESED